MKKIVILLVFLFAFFGINTDCVYSKDVIPTHTQLNQSRTFGLYQVGDDVTIYKEPSEKSHILYRVRWNKDEFFPETIGFDNFFVVFVENKSLALVAVTDYDDEWIEIIYDKAQGKRGWIKLDDPYKFMTWNNFYTTYGKKYGLSILKGAPESVLNIKSSTDDMGKTIATINKPKKINLNVLRGNWALVSVMDMDRVPKTGYVRWRSDDGIRYYFPIVK